MYNASSECPVLEILHSCTPDNNKEAVLQSFGKEDGPILVLVATTAFGMRVDCKGLHREIHFGPSKNCRGIYARNRTCRARWKAKHLLSPLQRFATKSC